MPWNGVSLVDERLEFIYELKNGDGTFKEVCEEYGISTKTGHKWVKRYDVEGFQGLQDQSRRPHRIPNRITRDTEEKIIALRLEDGWGAKKIFTLLMNQGIESVSIATINRVIERNGLLNPRKRHHPALNRFERKESMELLQSDFKGPMGRNHSNEPLTILDDHSRYILGLYAVKNHTFEETLPCFIDVFERFGVPKQMLFDHGTPWWSTSNEWGITRLSVALMRLDIELIFGRIRHPQTQGKVERFHRTLDDSVGHHGSPNNLTEWQSLYDHITNRYNNVRPHEALNMMPPVSRFTPSKRKYSSHIKAWVYPEGVEVFDVDSGGSIRIDSKRRFISESLVNEQVGVKVLEDRALVSYRNMYLRELDLATGMTSPLVCPVASLQ